MKLSSITKPLLIVVAQLLSMKFFMNIAEINIAIMIVKSNITHVILIMLKKQNLMFVYGKVSIVDLVTQIERPLEVQKFQEAAVYDHELVYMMADESIWRQNLRSNRATKLEGVNAKSMTVYRGVIYYEDVDNDNCIYQYNMETGEIKKTDEVLESYFVIEDGELVQYE